MSKEIRLTSEEEELFL